MAPDRSRLQNMVNKEQEGGHSTRKLRQEDDIRKEEGQDERCANRTHLPSDQDKHVLIPHSDRISTSSNTTNTIHSRQANREQTQGLPPTLGQHSKPQEGHTGY
ncbi:hypothetical protein CR513_03720, partial [Mucuna pruriens]